jgi:excinuclease ABC subunit B
MSDIPFEIHAKYEPAGDQPTAIESLVEGLEEGKPFQVLLGATGTGKTFTIAQVVERVQKPTLILVHNKTLAAQLYAEIKRFFPNNAVQYFVSYYNYYQPEAYVPTTNNYIPKDSSINEQIDKLRHSATQALLERRDVIIVSSVSCIYGIGDRDAYQSLLLYLVVGEEVGRQHIITRLTEMNYTHNDIEFDRGMYRVRGDVIDVFPASEDDRAIRIELFDDEVETIYVFDPLTGKKIKDLRQIRIFAASHYVTGQDNLKRAIEDIQIELSHRLLELEQAGKLVEKQRLEERTNYDLDMLRNAGVCAGIENYSRHLSGRNPGQQPPTLLEYFPEDWLLVMDESHVTLPQVLGMYKGDRSRKQTLVDYGFRLPSAMDNRPLQSEEFFRLLNKAIFVSATPAYRELERTNGEVVEQIIRPTGLLDPTIEIRQLEGQVDDLFGEIKVRASRNQRVLVTTLTKRKSEHLANYYDELGIKVAYLHSDIPTIERVEIIRDLRQGKYDVLIGINLLREGLDMPEVSLVAILDADKEGFLRNRTSLIQTMGRAARNIDGHVILYSQNKRITASMKAAIDETNRRRVIQRAHNVHHGIEPQPIYSEFDSPLELLFSSDAETDLQTLISSSDDVPTDIPTLQKRVSQLKKQMHSAAAQLDFEGAIRLRDEIKQLNEFLRVIGGDVG